MFQEIFITLKNNRETKWSTSKKMV